MHDVIFVFLRIHDPQDGVDAGKQCIHAVSVRSSDRIEVGKVDHGDIGERAASVLAHLADAEPLQQTGELPAAAGWDPRDCF